MWKNVVKEWLCVVCSVYGLSLLYTYWAISALEALRNALYKFKTCLLTYLLTYLLTFSTLESWKENASQTIRVCTGMWLSQLGTHGSMSDEYCFISFCLLRRLHMSRKKWPGLIQTGRSLTTNRYIGAPIPLLFGFGFSPSLIARGTIPEDEDDKIIIMPDRIHTLAIGHKNLVKVFS